MAFCVTLWTSWLCWACQETALADAVVLGSPNDPYGDCDDDPGMRLSVEWGGGGPRCCRPPPPLFVVARHRIGWLLVAVAFNAAVVVVVGVHLLLDDDDDRKLREALETSLVILPTDRAL
jgi:hypothetical protein